MLNDGLLYEVSKPDYAIALHVDGDLEAGKVGYYPGMFCKEVSWISPSRVGGHGAKPESG